MTHRVESLRRGSSVQSRALLTCGVCLLTACALPRLEIDESAVGGVLGEAGVEANGGSQSEAGSGVAGDQSSDRGGSSNGRGGNGTGRGGETGRGGSGQGRGGTPQENGGMITGEGGETGIGGIAGPGGALGEGGFLGQGGADNLGGVISSDGGSAGSGTVVCGSTGQGPLPMDETGWVARECNSWGIQGAYYCYSDTVAPTSCPPDAPPWDAGRQGMCINGETIVDPEYLAWGAGIGLVLNGVPESDEKLPYDATVYGVVGFRVGLEGSTGGQPYRVDFTTDAPMPEDYAPPSVEFTPLEGTQIVSVDLDEAMVPTSWDGVLNPGQTVDPTHFFEIQVAIVGGNEAAAYDFCVTSIEPILGATLPIGAAGASSGGGDVSTGSSGAATGSGMGGGPG